MRSGRTHLKQFCNSQLHWSSPALPHLHLSARRPFASPFHLGSTSRSIMIPTPAFLSPLPFSAPTVTGRRARFIPQCCETRPRQRSSNYPQFLRLPAVTGAIAGTLAFLFLPFSPPSYAAQEKPATTSKQLRYDGRQELDNGEKAMSLTLTAGTFAILGVWAWKQNRRDDELEEVRIKEEVERLEKLRAEFMDVEEDDQSMDDEDLLASLKQRIEDSEESGDLGGTSSTDNPEADPTAAQDEEKKGDDGSGTDSVNPNSVDMLKRMWEATDGDQKKKDDKS